MISNKSIERFKQVERLSRQTRHHRVHLNQMCDQKLCRELGNLTERYEKRFLRANLNQKLEEQRKGILELTIQQIANERQRSSFFLAPKNPTSEKLPQHSCRLFSHDCQLYPCQPIYHYRSFMKKEHDQTLRERHPSSPSSDDPNSNSSQLQNLLTNIQENKYQINRRQLVASMHNQSRLANRYASLERTKTRLDEESRLLHERLYDKRKFTYAKGDQYQIKQAIKRHLEISAKFCA